MRKSLSKYFFGCAGFILIGFNAIFILDDFTPKTEDKLIEAENIKNPVESFESVKELAEKGNDRALYVLGNYYRYGKGTPKNNELALKCYEDALRFGHGYLPAITALGDCYFYGIGVQKIIR